MLVLHRAAHPVARSDQRTAKRLDRAADRDDDADLAAYNNMLAKLAKLEER